MQLKGFYFILLLLPLQLPISLMAQSLNLQNPVKFLALGDSYTIGQSVPADARWPVQLTDSLQARGYDSDGLRIIATTGWRTDNLINAIRNQNLASEGYNLVSLLIGVNNQYQGRPFSQYISEFPALVDSAIRYAGDDPSHVFIVSIPDYAYTPFGQQSSNPAQISIEIDQYNNYARQVAADKGIYFFDITPISRLGLQYPSYVAGDGLHPSEVQYTEWVRLILAYIDSQTTGEESLKELNLDVAIHPNPATDKISIEIPVSNPGPAFTARLYNLTGKLISQHNFSGNHFDISIAGQPEGLYFLKIISGDKQAIRKVVKRG